MDLSSSALSLNPAVGLVGVATMLPALTTLLYLPDKTFLPSFSLDNKVTLDNLVLFYTAEVSSPVKSIFSLGLGSLVGDINGGARILIMTVSSGVLVGLLFLGGSSVVDINVGLLFKLTKVETPLPVPLLILLLRRAMVGGR